MNICVCIKQVPDTAEAGMDPETGRINRSGLTNILNPLDLNALEEAARLKEKYGGRVTALSMGPAQAETALREALARGADRGVLCTDRRFAGGDTWATSVTLALAVRRLEAEAGKKFDLLICGRQAVDGDTAQVPPELSVSLGIPFVGCVRKIKDVETDRAGNFGFVTAESLIDKGYEILRAPLPAVMTVVKDINVPRLPSFPDWVRAREAVPDHLSSADLDPIGERTGASGSPTRVLRISGVDHAKKTEFLNPDKKGDIRKLISLFTQALGRGELQNQPASGREPGSGEKDLSVPAAVLPQARVKTERPLVLVLGELATDPATGRTGISAPTLELAAAAAGLARAGNARLGVCFTAAGPGTVNPAVLPPPEVLLPPEVDRVFFILPARPLTGTADICLRSFMAAEVLRELRPEIAIGPATMDGRAFMPLLAARLETGLTADCTGLAIDPESGNLLQTRPAFGGNIMAVIVCGERRPQMATVRPHVFPAPPKLVPFSNEKIEYFYAAVECSARSEVLDRVHSLSPDLDISNARIILSGGRGLEGAAGFSLLRETALRLGPGVSVGASRAAVEAGWAPYPQQIGQTGKTVQPALYVAAGISGAVQHLAGMNNSDKVLAINTDAEAPIFRAADYGIVGDYRAVLGKIIRHFKGRNR